MNVMQAMALVPDQSSSATSMKKPLSSVMVNIHGVFATCNCEEGEHLFTERPLYHASTLMMLTELVNALHSTMQSFLVTLQKEMGNGMVLSKVVNGTMKTSLSREELQSLRGRSNEFVKQYCFLKNILLSIRPIDIQGLTAFYRSNFEQVGVFPLASQIRHRCIANAEMVFSATDQSVTLIALAPIQVGEEICVNIFGFGLFTCGYALNTECVVDDYQSLLETTTVERPPLSTLFLKEEYGCTCSCDLCIDVSGSMSPHLDVLRKTRIGDSGRFWYSLNQWLNRRYRICMNWRHLQTLVDTKTYFVKEEYFISSQKSFFESTTYPLLEKLCEAKLVFWWLFVLQDIVEGVLQGNFETLTLDHRLERQARIMVNATLHGFEPAVDDPDREFVWLVRPILSRYAPDYTRKMLLCLYQLQFHYPNLGITTSDLRRRSIQWPQWFQIHLLLFRLNAKHMLERQRSKERTEQGV